jgi:hypothetical protein
MGPGECIGVRGRQGADTVKPTCLAEAEVGRGDVMEPRMRHDVLRLRE